MHVQRFTCNLSFIEGALANQVTSQTNDISSAKILAQQKTISENSDLYLTCSAFGKKKQISVTVYLCKGDLWIDKKLQKQDQNDTTFTIQRVGLHHSGNYSCVYSTRGDLPTKVTKKREPIEIVVISNFLPADISVAAPSDVHEGDDVAFRCIVSGPLQTLGECQLIHSYLMRNQTILQVQAFNVPGMEANFTIEGAVVRDSGHYSCVVLPSKCIQEGEKTLYGNNTVLVEVKESLIFRLIASFGVIALMILLGLCLWWINKQGGYFASNSCVADQQADMTEERQVQREGEDLDAQFDSFSMEQDEEYQNLGDEDFTYSADHEGVYSVAGPVYAMSSRALP
ncbi:uncharacterized protein LOC117471293 isoform X2 [Trematomus bernacchii]|uniref:uncharacterized protein LOC117471293 isoform X2 n=1 Tax=Trematomus bernacchii TaxID=40690 RepID=UPI00146F8A2F|nr:uncharacterized protein LOC117471293 isoform X2 [Trematomus bernacchii]